MPTAGIHEQNWQSPALSEKTFADFLEAESLIDAADANRAWQAAQQSGIRFSAALVHLGLISDDACRDALARHGGMTAMTAAQLTPDPQLSALMPFGFMRENHVLPVTGEKGEPVLVMADPTDAQTAKAAALALGRRLGIHVASRAALDRTFESLLARAAGGPGGQETAAQPNPAPPGNAADISRLRDLASEAPVIRRVNQMLREAVERQASDLHLEPSAQGLRPRLRVDGVLSDGEPIGASLAAPVMSRLKLLAGMDIAESRLPQDGRIRTSVHGRAIDLRVATLPSLHGETMVIRVLDPAAAADMRLAGLGFSDAVLEQLRALIGQPNGMLLVTGPTGSGKTTTLYAALRDLNQPTRKIVTVEDPIEYELPGVVQIQVKPDIGLGFAAVLRASLRHNPDILLVGEIRDLETAHIAVEAALTGHQVLATLHANSAAASVTRLADLGLDDYLISATLRGALSQRLIRKICPSCARPQKVAAGVVARHLPAHAAPASDEVTLYEPTGCAQCHHSGFNGRAAIHELLRVDDPIRAMIHRRAAPAEIEASARAQGFTSLREQGIGLALAGMTTLGEVLRVTGDA